MNTKILDFRLKNTANVRLADAGEISFTRLSGGAIAKKYPFFCFTNL